MADDLELLRAKALAERERAMAQTQAQTGGPSVGLSDFLVQGATFGLGDEVAAAGAGTGAALKSAFGDITEGRSPQGMGTAFSEAYDRRLGAQRQGMDAYRGRHPVAATAAEIGGGVMTAGQLASGGATLMNMARPTVGGMALRGAGEGALYGGAYGLGTGEGAQDRLVKGAYGAVLGGATGAGSGAVAGRLARPKAPATASLREQAKAAYQAADDAGVIISKDSFNNFARNVQQRMADEGIDATMQPRALAALNRLTSVDDNLTLKGAEILRRVAKNAAASNDPSERRLAKIMVESLDDYVSGLRPGDLVSGDAGSAVSALKNARNLWSRSAKADMIEGLIDRARTRASQFSGSGYENAIRTEFRTLARNPKRMRMFSDAEQQAIRKVAEGGPVGNALRLLGKFAPTGVVSQALGGGIGYSIGGPAGAVALPAAGFAARQGATAATARNARLASELMRTGGQQIPSQLSPQQQLLMRSLMTTGAVEGPRGQALLNTGR